MAVTGDPPLWPGLPPLCACCGDPYPRRSPDPWEGRMDAYCRGCAETRCDAYPGACAAVKPRRDDDVAAWIKRERDRHNAAADRLADNGAMDFRRMRLSHMADGMDHLLDRYRECSDHGLTLGPADPLPGTGQGE